MTSKLQQFLNVYNELGGAAAFVFRNGDIPSLVMQAKSTDVGDLVVLDEGSELTVEIGEKFHSHFSPYLYGDPANEISTQAAVEDAVNFVLDLIADRIVFTVDYQGKDCIGSSCLHEDADSREAIRTVDCSTESIDEPSKATRSEVFTWSGPKT